MRPGDAVPQGATKKQVLNTLKSWIASHSLAMTASIQRFRATEWKRLNGLRVLWLAGYRPNKKMRRSTPQANQLFQHAKHFLQTVIARSGATRQSSKNGYAFYLFEGLFLVGGVSLSLLGGLHPPGVCPPSCFALSGAKLPYPL